MRPTIGSLRGLAFLTLLCFVLPIAAQEHTKGEGERLWISRSQDLEQLDDELARLYQTLEEADALPPDLELTTRHEWILHEKRAGEDVGPLILETLGGCKQLDAACRELLGEMNDHPETLLDPASEGRFWLPLLRVETWLDIGDRPEVEQRLEKNLVPELKLHRRPGELSGEAPEQEIEPFAWHSFLASATGSVRVLATPDSLAYERPSRPRGFDTEPIDAAAILERSRWQSELALRQQQVFELIELPADDELGALPFTPRVVVVDGVVDPGHCGFDRERVEAFDLAGKRIEPDDRPPAICGDPVHRPEHGTHVAGLIAANGTPAKLRGVNPRVRLQTFAINLDDPTVDEQQARKIFDLAKRDLPNVMNLSWDYSLDGTGDVDPIVPALESLERTTLVVAAAGNDDLENGSSCSYRPACLELPNLLVVAALDLETDDPDLWQERGHRSHWGRHRVHLAAPGDAIPSISDRHQCGELSGTSQAAPLVSGAASLLIAKYGALEPHRVRDRLIYTSKLARRLLDRLFGGRVDIRHALDGDLARFELGRGALVRCGESQDKVFFLEQGGLLRGTVFNLTAGDGTSPGRSFQVRRLDDPTRSRSLEVDQLKRMTRLDWRHDGVFSLFVDPPGSPPLERWEARLESPGRRVWLEIEDSPLPELAGYCQFELRHLADYTAPLIEKAPGP